MVTHDYTTNTQEANTEGLVGIQGQNELCYKLKASLGYKMKPVLTLQLGVQPLPTMLDPTS